MEKEVSDHESGSVGSFHEAFSWYFTLKSFCYEVSCIYLDDSMLQTSLHHMVLMGQAAWWVTNDIRGTQMKWESEIRATKQAPTAAQTGVPEW